MKYNWKYFIVSWTWTLNKLTFSSKICNKKRSSYLIIISSIYLFQDITQRLLEAIGNIGGSSLEQTTWLRRNLAVKPGPQTDRPEEEETSELDEGIIFYTQV